MNVIGVGKAENKKRRKKQNYEIFIWFFDNPVSLDSGLPSPAGRN